MRLAVVQIKTSREAKENLAKILHYLDEAKQKAVDLVVFPETAMAFIPGNEGINFNDIAQEQSGEFVQEILQASKRLAISLVFGFYEKSDDSMLGCATNTRAKNSVIFAVNGEILHTYSKTHLYNAFSYNESKDIIASSNAIKAFDTPFCKVGIMVCYELRFPEIARTLALQGAELIIVPTAWVASSRDVELKKAHLRLLTRTRALENTIFLCMATQTHNIYTGGSAIIDPLGWELLKLDDSETMGIANIDFSEINRVREFLPCLYNRHPKLYDL